MFEFYFPKVGRCETKKLYVTKQPGPWTGNLEIIKFSKISVGATENILIASCFANGKTRLRNCALEPEVKDLITFLKKLGCLISFVGKRDIDVIGIKELGSAKHKVIFDRIEAGTYIIAAALTNGNIKVTNVDPKIMSTEINLLNKMKIKIIKKKNYIS